MRTLLAACLVTLVLSAHAGGNLLGFKAPDIFLQDQYGLPFALRAEEGRIVVLVAGDREASEQCHAWGSAVAKRYGETVTVIGLADARQVPFFLKGSVKSSFRKDTARVLLDWEGTVFDRYGFKPGIANVVLIDRRGFVRHVLSGLPARSACRLFFQHVDRALR